MAGIHQTLKEVRELYASLAGSAERAERAVERVEDLEKRVAGLVHKKDWSPLPNPWLVVLSPSRRGTPSPLPIR